MSATDHLSQQFGPLYHGTAADLPVGGKIEPGRPGNWSYSGTGLDHDVSYAHATPHLEEARMYAENAARAKGPQATPRVYGVKPTGHIESDPNYDDENGPTGNSWRSRHPLEVTHTADTYRNGWGQ